MLEVERGALDAGRGEQVVEQPREAARAARHAVQQLGALVVLELVPVRAQQLAVPPRTPTGERSSWAVTARKCAWSSAACSSRALASSSRALASRRSVMSRVTLAKPTSSPSSSRTAVIVTCAQNAVPSLRTRHPSSS